MGRKNYNIAIILKIFHTKIPPMKEKNTGNVNKKLGNVFFLIQESHSPALSSKLKKELVREFLLLKVTITHLHFLSPEYFFLKLSL